MSILAESAPAVRRSPRPVAWVLLLASAAAVLVTGIAGTALVVNHLSGSPTPIRPVFWLSLLSTAGLTLISLGLRALRWIFLLRRADTRIPIRDAYIGYLAGLSLLLAPFLLGEIAVRAHVLRVRGRVPVATTALLNVWERLLDLVALAMIAAGFLILSGHIDVWSIGLLAAAALTMIEDVRRAARRMAIQILDPVLRLVGAEEARVGDRLVSHRAWLTALGASIAAWTLPGIGLWLIVAAWRVQQYDFGFGQAQVTYASSALVGGVTLAPGGVVVAGGRLLSGLTAAGLPDVAAALSVLGIRLATVGVATVLGGIFVLVHLRAHAPAAGSHFDAIADAYDVQIPESRRQSLLTKKTELMRDVLQEQQAGRRGLDVGCGQGWYVRRMREMGFAVTGIDESASQVALAARHIESPQVAGIGSVLEIPAADSAYDFVYVINVLHHLSSIDEQRAAFAEMARVLRPGGWLFVHEINTRNILFRFYMGYIFPSLNCIDEGVERWLLPHRLGRYTDLPVIVTRYFTFLPEFVPDAVVRLLAPLERLVERSPVGVYSAHYMAVLRKPA